MSIDIYRKQAMQYDIDLVYLKNIYYNSLKNFVLYSIKNNFYIIIFCFIHINDCMLSSFQKISNKFW